MNKIVVVGSINVDYVVNVKHIPQIGETILADGLTITPGGKGANQAFAAGKLGGNVAMLGAAGEDDHGELLRSSLSSANVDVTHIKSVQGVNTGLALINVSEDGDNNIVVISGANMTVDRAYIDEQLSILQECDIVLLQLEIPLDTVTYVAKKAKALGKLVILDPAPAIPDLSEELLQCVDILKPNETELGILLGDPDAVDHLSQATDRLLAKGVKNVVVTLGGKGAYLKDSLGRSCSFSPRPGIRPVDTTAAGDGFTAAMALRLAQGAAIDEAIEFAMRVAEIIITRKGAQISIPTLTQVQQLLGTQAK